MTVHCQAALEARAALVAHEYEPAPLGAADVEIAVTHCGICHSDIHMIDNDWGMSRYPLVPGHEVVGTVRAVGAAVRHLTAGQRVGVGWQSASCGTCEWCVRGDDNCCPTWEATCVGRPGGFATALRVDGRFAFPLPDGLPSETAAPLLCAGVTVYSPLRHVAATARVGVIGVGGLGHLALQFARAWGCEVTAFSTSPDKAAEAQRFGAAHFVNSRADGALDRLASSFDLLICTASGAMRWAPWLNLLRPHGTLAVVGAVPGTFDDVGAMALIGGEKCIRGSAIGSRGVMQEMLAFAARHGIRAQVETAPLAAANAAVAKVRANQARYRMVLVMP